MTAYLTEAEYDLVATLPGRTLAKRRFEVPVDGAMWSLEVFEDGLASMKNVEIECGDDEALDLLVPPSRAVREVSALLDWQGGALARHGRLAERH